jgi:hypothetical protein
MYNNADAEGAWIFLSHSHKDLRKVREIRDELERRGHNPLIFFLKCLEDEGTELPDLLRREIGTRTWFILCDSPNAQQSKWVQEEVEMIKSLEGKVFEIVDLSKDLRTQLHKLAALAKRATVFLSYTRSDYEVASKIIHAFRSRDYKVLLPQDSIQLGRKFVEQMTAAIDHAMHEGCFILLLSLNSVASYAVVTETQYAFSRLSKLGDKSNIVPIFLDNREAATSVMPPSLQLLLSGIQAFDFSLGELDSNIEDLVTHLKAREMG